MDTITDSRDGVHDDPGHAVRHRDGPHIGDPFEYKCDEAYPLDDCGKLPCFRTFGVDYRTQTTVALLAPKAH